MTTVSSNNTSPTVIRPETIRLNFKQEALWTVGECACFAVVTMATIRGWIRRGLIPAKSKRTPLRVYSGPFRRFVELDEPQKLLPTDHITT